MLKKSYLHWASLIGLTTLIILFNQPFVHFLAFIKQFEQQLAYELSTIFSQGFFGSLLQHLLTFILIPFLFTGVITLVYKLIRKQPFPFFYTLVWGLWLILIILNLFTQ